jgi:hypothetical protein
MFFYLTYFLLLHGCVRVCVFFLIDNFFDLQEIKLLSFIFYVHNFIILHYILAYFSFVLMLVSLSWHFSVFHDHVNVNNLLTYFYGT